MRMPTIAVPVDPDTARAFAQASDEEQRKLKLLLSLRLRELTSAPGRPLGEVLDEVGRKAEARGMTPQVLESLLNGS
jgi:hypothetical protein